METAEDNLPEKSFYLKERNMPILIYGIIIQMSMGKVFKFVKFIKFIKFIKIVRHGRSSRCKEG
ncbi:MAG: hypothetical protein HY959_13630 [Ignavibacteriae bacterium]|nr:hypothetical protein [Ignavibacteriota bacterium]